MEELKFDLSKWPDPMDQANAIMSFIVNRAALFNTNNYSSICIEIPDNNRGCIAFNLIFAIAPFIKMPIYTTRKVRKNSFWVKNKIIKRKTKFLYDRKWNNPETMKWTVEKNKEGINILDGISDRDIDFIVEQLYSRVVVC